MRTKFHCAIFALVHVSKMMCTSDLDTRVLEHSNSSPPNWPIPFTLRLFYFLIARRVGIVTQALIERLWRWCVFGGSESSVVLCRKRQDAETINLDGLLSNKRAL